MISDNLKNINFRTSILTIRRGCSLGVGILTLSVLKEYIVINHVEIFIKMNIIKNCSLRLYALPREKG